MTSFRVLRTEPLVVDRPESLKGMYTLSPYVWQADGAYAVLLRMVPHCDDEPAKKISTIYAGTSEDGLVFNLPDHPPVLAPGPEPEDKDGCEDPTLTVVGDQTYVYYSGWNEAEQVGRMLLAAGPDVQHLEKQGIRIDSSKSVANPKEATLVELSDGTWRLFFEYAADDASKIGLASSETVDGPWKVLDDPFTARSLGWDSWHLSPGPMLTTNPDRPIMFYNGATKDTVWRIGWVAFDANCTNVVDRGELPIFEPPPPEGDESDIAFAASCVEVDGEIWLYYSLADQYLYRTSLDQSGNVQAG